jgi:hypothetical protein
MPVEHEDHADRTRSVPPGIAEPQSRFFHFFQTAAKDAEPDSAVARFAQEDRELSQAGHGRLVVAPRTASPIKVVVRQKNRVIDTRKVAEETHLDLPAGTYELLPADAPGASPWSHRLTLLIGGHKRVELPPE